MATEQTGLIHHAAVAAADLSAYQYYLVKLGASGWNLCTTQGETGVIGILLNDPESGEVCNVMLLGKGKVKAGGTLSLGDLVCTNSSGKAIECNDHDEAALGKTLATAVANDIVEVVYFGGVAHAEAQAQETYTSSAQY